MVGRRSDGVGGGGLEGRGKLEGEGGIALGDGGGMCEGVGGMKDGLGGKLEGKLDGLGRGEGLGANWLG